MDIKIDNNSDMVIQNGDLVFVKDQDAIAQHLQMRLMTWMTESVYDRNDGVPYLQVVFQPGTSLNAVRFILEQRARQTPGVTGCVINLVLDRETRVVTGTGTATSVRGDIVFSLTLSPDAGSVVISS